MLACQHGNDNLHYWTTNSYWTLNDYIKGFNYCFYFFTGFEIFATSGRNVAYSKQDISWGIIIVLLLNILIHVVIALIFFAAFRSFYQNMNMGTWNGFHNLIILIGRAVMIISTIALKINVVIQGNLYGRTSLQFLVGEGFLMASLKK